MLLSSFFPPVAEPSCHLLHTALREVQAVSVGNKDLATFCAFQFCNMTVSIHIR